MLMPIYWKQTFQSSSNRITTSLRPSDYSQACSHFYICMMCLVSKCDYWTDGFRSMSEDEWMNDVALYLCIRLFDHIFKHVNLISTDRWSGTIFRRKNRKRKIDQRKTTVWNRVKDVPSIRESNGMNVIGKVHIVSIMKVEMARKLALIDSKQNILTVGAQSA